ncbi:uncharacterized protein EI90DRAFT_3125294 [Cantharellus anzutake]|uniref:uncharacterized protein n=1 Tax=Cantharellus anzutake TaxID=1750568 RepID=UPI001907CF0F|nr:uncharacterized protein EI90DRAFT_3125294 [Cantharellus anzutake]KAF8329535.1 hypothetical protein EI90DRAFT_3125294 [Cantharellus anzutake]
MKPSEHSPPKHHWAGLLPPGVAQHRPCQNIKGPQVAGIVRLGGSKMRALISGHRSPYCPPSNISGKVGFTGSAPVGPIVGSICGKYINLVLLELASLIVLSAASSILVRYACRQLHYWVRLIGIETPRPPAPTPHPSVGRQVYCGVEEKQLASVKAGHIDDSLHKLKGLFYEPPARRAQAFVIDAASKGGGFVLGSADEYKGRSILQPTIIDHATPEEMDAFPVV